MRRSASGRERARNATNNAVKFAIDPPLTRMPAASEANPTSSPNHRTAMCSTAVAAGADRHEGTFLIGRRGKQVRRDADRRGRREDVTEKGGRGAPPRGEHGVTALKEILERLPVER